MKSTPEIEIIRSLVRVFPRANLTLEQVFALDHAKMYLKAFDSGQDPHKLRSPSVGDGHR